LAEEITVTILNGMFKFAGEYSEKGFYFRGEYKDHGKTAYLPQRLGNCCGCHSEERNREWFTGASESLGIGTPCHPGKGKTTRDSISAEPHTAKRVTQKKQGGNGYRIMAKIKGSFHVRMVYIPAPRAAVCLGHSAPRRSRGTLPFPL
jgi:hypothetical protein